MNAECVGAANSYARSVDKALQQVNRLVSIYQNAPQDCRRVLVCDDNDVLREILVHVLKGQGFETVEAANGAEALIAIERNHLGCAVMDLNMPNMNGHEVLKALKERGTKINVYILTGEDLSEEDRQGLITRYGVKQVFTKPCSMAQIAACLKEDHAETCP